MEKSAINSNIGMTIKDRKFLVIGGGGFIGSHVVEELLKEGAGRVIVFDNFTRGSKENLAEALKDERVSVFSLGGDIVHEDLLKSAMAGVDGVFHLAALWLLHCQDFEKSAFKVNIEGTFNVIQAALAAGVKRIVYSSSASVYGDAMTEPMQEEHPYNNTNFYGATKIAGEHIFRSLFHRYKATPNRFDFVGLRYMNVYGARQDYRGAYIAVIMKMLDRLDQGLAPEIYGDGTQAYDFIHVRDCARANVAAMKAETTDEFYNVGTGRKTSIAELTSLVLKLTDPSMKAAFKPAGQTFVKNRVGCPKKAENDLGFVAKTVLEDGLQELIEWRTNHKAEVDERRKAVGG